MTPYLEFNKDGVRLNGERITVKDLTDMVCALGGIAWCGDDGNLELWLPQTERTIP